MLSELICSAVTQITFRGEIFHDFPRNLVKITENRGNFGENIAPRIVVCVPSLQINSESTKENHRVHTVCIKYIYIKIKLTKKVAKK